VEKLLKGCGLNKDLGFINRKQDQVGKKRGDLFIFDLFVGKHVHTTELLTSLLKAGNHTLLKEFSHLYIGILNPYDLMANAARDYNFDYNQVQHFLTKKEQQDFRALLLLSLALFQHRIYPIFS
jgi:hypothetical protein